MTTIDAQAEQAEGTGDESASSSEETRAGKEPRRFGASLAVLAFFILVLFGGLVYFGGGLGDRSGLSLYKDASERFAGGPAREDIRDAMVPVFAGFEMELSPETVAAVTETLVSLGEEFAVPEMEILYCLEGRGAKYSGLRDFERIATGCAFLVQTLGPGGGKA